MLAKPLLENAMEDDDGGSLWRNQDISQEARILTTASLAVLPPGEVYVPFPPGTGRNAGSYYSCPGWMLEHDPIYPTPGFDPRTQKQVMCTIWRSQTSTFQSIIDTMPRETPKQTQGQQQM